MDEKTKSIQTYISIIINLPCNIDEYYTILINYVEKIDIPKTEIKVYGFPTLYYYDNIINNKGQKVNNDDNR